MNFHIPSRRRSLPTELYGDIQPHPSFGERHRRRCHSTAIQDGGGQVLQYDKPLDTSAAWHVRFVWRFPVRSII
jgi:hypothetical protein